MKQHNKYNTILEYTVDLLIKTCQLIELTFTEQWTTIMFNNPYSISQKFQIGFPENKNTMNKPRMNRFNFNWTGLFFWQISKQNSKWV